MPAPFRTGDLLPATQLLDAAGEAFDLHQQSLAGRFRLVLLGPSPDTWRLQAAETRAKAQDARIFIVSQGSPEGGDRVGGAVHLFDPKGKLFLGLGLPDGGAAVISPRGQLHFSQAGSSALEAALDALPPPASRAAVHHTLAPVLLVPNVLEPPLVAALLAHWQAGEKSQDRVASAKAGAGAGPGIKRRTDVFLDDRALYAEFQRRLERRVLPEMWRAFRFRAASFEAPRIGCYAADVAGAFGAHRDNRTPFTAHRRFAMSLNLNTGDYRGGTLRFPEFGPDVYEPGTGGCAVFCCDLLHEALPVVEGRRFAIFTFFTDAEGAQQERKLMAEAAARGQSGVSMR
ncbi:2OG-Fe(II) oxygenase [Falsiroseomonas sp. HC035]|uniref:2OG-Fe(II) oxygenase n=1 Tax=Falsiroseomonas sp. HC035 TaxID=3390999 RepID=UPI003D311E7D